MKTTLQILAKRVCAMTAAFTHTVLPACVLMAACASHAWGDPLFSVQFGPKPAGGPVLQIGDEAVAAAHDAAYIGTSPTWNRVSPTTSNNGPDVITATGLADRNGGLTTIGFATAQAVNIWGESPAFPDGPQGVYCNNLAWGPALGTSSVLGWEISGLTPGAAYKLVVYGMNQHWGCDVTVDTNGSGALDAGDSTQALALVGGHAYNNPAPIYFTGTVAADGIVRGQSIRYAGNQGAGFDAGMMGGFQLSLGAVPSAFYNITATAETGGTISPPDVSSVAEHGTQIYTITPNPKYLRATVLVDDVNDPDAVASGTYTFTNVTTTHKIKATFVPVPPGMIPGVTMSAWGSQSAPPGNDRQALHLVDNSGMSDAAGPTFADGTHGNEANGYMWMGNGTPESGGSYRGWLVFDLGASYFVDKIHVWNWNEAASLSAGVKLVGISYSEDNSTWSTPVNYTFDQATGLTDYAGHIITLVGGGFSARYVRFDCRSSWGAWSSYSWDAVGLSEVRFNNIVPPTLHDITASAGSNGTISPLGVTPVVENSTPTYTITADYAYGVADVVVDGTIHLGSVTTYTFPAVTAPHTIDATFVYVGPPPGLIHGVTIADVSQQGRPAIAVVDNSGMSDAASPTFEGGTHGTVAGYPPDGHPYTMWQSYAAPATPTWITFDLGASYTVDKIHVWNFNEGANVGAKSVDISYSADNLTYSTPVNYTFDAATNTTDYAGQIITLTGGGFTARYVRFDILSTIDLPTASWCAGGLSEVRFNNAAPPVATTPFEDWVGNPSPPGYGLTGDNATVTTPKWMQTPTATTRTT